MNDSDSSDVTPGRSLMSSSQEDAGDAPIRGEILTLDRLGERAEELASSQEWTSETVLRPSPLPGLVDRAAKDLEVFEKRMTEAIRLQHSTVPATEWLLDNSYLLEGQLRLTDEDFPPQYANDLPRLTAGPLKGYPRTYELAVTLIEHVDSRLDTEGVNRFVTSFQKTRPLDLGEVWALPILMRIALLENLRRLAAIVLEASTAEQFANDWADRLLLTAQEGSESLETVLKDLSRRANKLPPSFFLRLLQRLQDQEADVAPIMTWIEEQVESSGVSLERYVLSVQQQRASNQVSIANAITSLRFLAALDWRQFFEEHSAVDAILHRDPIGIYSQMDFPSRDRYRHAVEQLAKRCPISQIGVAEAAVARAEQGLSAEPSDPLLGHVGYYLVSSGRYGFEDSLKYKPRGRERAYRGPLRFRAAIYYGTVIGTTALLMLLLGLFALSAGAAAWQALVLMLLGALPLSDFATTNSNRIAALLWPARSLLRIDPSKPIAERHRTLVVSPALLTSVDGVRDLIDNLEVHYLANSDPNIHFALLGDLRASASEHLSGDAAILEAARLGIQTLNERYAAEGPGGVFHLFIRPRTYNAEEDSWMGWERKRGALVQLNRTLRGIDEGAFTVRLGDASFLPGVTFVLTVDSDTTLPRDAARKLISTIAHPLNRARFDADARKVTRGYGLVQPHVGISLSSAQKSYYSQLYTGLAGIDPYSGAISDTYQDVFDEGSFTGKGIFEVGIFLSALEDRIPEDRLLSHDLLEGCFLRTGLASDIDLFDDYPSTYTAQTARVHRWVRGDWQTLPWLGRRVPTGSGGRQPNPLSFLHRWKLADNLRRSLLPPATLVFVTLGWLLVPHPGIVWPVIVFLMLFPQAYMRLGDLLFFYPTGFTLVNALRATRTDLVDDLDRAFLMLVVLPHQAQVMLDAVIRALWRQLVSHRHMLEWTTAAEAELSHEATLGTFVSRMLPSSIGAVVLLLPVALLHRAEFPFVLPAMLTFLAAPVAAYLISRPVPTRHEEATARDRITMRRIARKTWRYFDTFASAADHWLAPDNFQEDPVGVVAHRTSPTNIGLQLLACLTAYDLGYTSLGDLVERVSRAVQTMAGLELFRGHFYNWYDTETLAPIRPTYVSTVDSGNLAGHLLVLQAGLTEAAERPLIGPRVIEGLADTLGLAIETLLVNKGGSPSDEVVQIRLGLEELQRRVDIEKSPRNLGAWAMLLDDIAAASDSLPNRLIELAASGVMLPPGAAAAVQDVSAEVQRHQADIDSVAPWTRLLTEAPAGLRECSEADRLLPLFENVPSLVGLAEGLSEALGSLDRLAEEPEGETEETRCECRDWCSSVRDGILAARPAAIELLARLRLMATIARETWQHTDFTLLYDTSREVFSIGFNVAEGRLDNSYYDMLASECRLASYIAIAKGDIPQRHWFKLARPLADTGFGYALISWSASMFEYLMPLLVMPDWPDTLLDRTYRAVVKRQIQYGRQRGVPWGVSESAYNARDAAFTYQYQAFGVPGLGLKRGLSEDAVVAPYATMLALPVDLRASLDNLTALTRLGAEGYFGYYEALDFTPGRVPAGQERAIVKSYFAHHQGMSFVALGNELCASPMPRRFLTDPVMQSAELLLQEKVPRHITPTAPHVEEVEVVRSLRDLPPPVARSYPLADTPAPATHFLSNGRYSVMVTNAGGGYSRFLGHSVSRYREDITRDCWGTFFYLKDLDTSQVWSSAFQPTLVQPDDYHCTFSADKAEYRRHDGDIETHTEVVVSPEDDVEVRRITITNHGRRTRQIECTSYFEIALAGQESDQTHRTFSNLFVETSHIEEGRAILFTRRPRSADEERLWGVHVLASEFESPERCDCETDRAAFLGRLRSTTNPQAVFGDQQLGGGLGAVLDPACSLRQTVRVAAGDSARLTYATGVAETRQEALRLAERYRDSRSGQRAADMAWTGSQIELRDLGITPDEAVLFQRLASRLLLTDPQSRLKVKPKVENELPISALWGLGISGDHPIMMVKIDRQEEISLVRQVLLAHQYWRHKGLRVDLVVMNTRPSAYVEELDGRLHLLVRTGHALQLLDKPGGVFLRKADQIDPAVLNLLESVARVVLVGDRGPMRLQLNQSTQHPLPPDPLYPKGEPQEWPPAEFERPELAFDNGLGGFDTKNNEYVIVLEGDATTPAPWINVVSNAGFGSMVSEAGVGCTWATNSHENRLTTWNNDPVSDGSGELIYVRDEETGEFWSPTPLPVRESTPYVIRHGRGYSTFEHDSHGVAHELTWFVPIDDPVRVARLSLTNLSDRPRRLSVTHLVEWSLGSSRSAAQHRVVTWYEPEQQVLMAHNWYNVDFPGRPAFVACDRPLDGYTASRTEFIGRNGQPADPSAMHRKGLGSVTGRFHDNCGALMTGVELEPGATVDIVWLLGQTAERASALHLVGQYREPGRVEKELDRTKKFWNDLLDTVRVLTPDPALDILLNGPLLYQTLACRFWGRTALYQSSGAFGFRDQLQDTLALLYTRPDLARGHIVEATRHQFEQGDVLHWWMPVSGRGVRTRITDDRHWLAYVLAEYIQVTGDTGILDEETHFIEGGVLDPDKDDAYLEPKQSLAKATVYEHVLRAMESGRDTGPHELPLFGGGDWNDGMNRVGREGRGESVWLAWFLDVVLRRLAEICELRGDVKRASGYREWSSELVRAIESDGWDGAWYLRGYFDDGSPLGSKSSEECKIDSVAQSWAVISGAGDHNRALRAMSAVEEKLVRWESELVALLAPPFDQTPRDPGYIKGYVPGVRENGGQYSHAAIWVAMAYLLMGDGDEGLELLDLINPVNHALDPEAVGRYKVEPYVLAADVYAVEPHVGRGGWTWYTGSASWFYTVALRQLLGLRPVSEKGTRFLLIDPCIPKDWPGFSAEYRFGSATYDIRVENPRGVNRGVEQVSCDDEVCPDRRLPLVDDGEHHKVIVRLLGG